MTAEQIRKLASDESNWDGGFDQNRMILIGEIAAQLSEHNAHMERIEFLLENCISINYGGLQVKVNR